MHPKASIFPPGGSSFLANVYISIALQCQVMDPAWYGWLMVAVHRVSHVRCGPHNADLTTWLFHFPLSNHGHATAVVPRYGTSHNDLVI